MARRKLIWHLGLAQPPRAVVGVNLAAHAAVLEGGGRRVVATPREAALATAELLRTHRAAGFTRDEVDGQWARIADRVWAHKGTSLLSTPDLCMADKDQLRLALDPLIGVEVHLVFTVDSWSQQLYGGWLAELRAGRSTGWEKYVARVLDRTAGGAPGHRQAEDFWAGHELASVLARWGWTFHADRLHVVLEQGPARHWSAFLDIAGLPDDLELPVVVPPPADPAGAVVLRRVNRELDAPLAVTSSGLLTRADDEGSAQSWDSPVADTNALRPLLVRWAETFSAAGYDVRGDLEDLVDSAGPGDFPGAHDQLGAAVAALADALAENGRLRAEVLQLEADKEHLDRKRRKHKRRFEQLRAASRN